MDENSMTHFPAVRLASAAELQHKYSVNNEPKLESSNSGPKLIKLSPTHGKEETVITVVVQALPTQLPVKLAFNNLIVNTNQMRGQDITSLVASVPPFKHIRSSTSSVPVTICFLDEDVVTATQFVANFKYDIADETCTLEKPPFNSMGSPFQPKDNNSTAAAYQTYYSPPVIDPLFRFGTPVPSYQPYSYQQRETFDKYNNQQISSGQQYSGCSPTLGSYTTTDSSEFTNLLADINRADNSSATTVRCLTQSKRSDQQTDVQDNSNSKSTGYQHKKAPYIPTTPIANYHPYPGLISRANLNIIGDLDTMTKNWITDEWKHGRRIVQFGREQERTSINCHFQPISQEEALFNSGIVVSCIYWEEKNNFFITSVDCIYLLEALIDIRFGVEEKNRIRRNLEGFRPMTISKSKAESSDFFKLIMGFPKPKPRNIEKDIKVFPWKILPYALKKIITKYTATESLFGHDIQKSTLSNQHINSSVLANTTKTTNVIPPFNGANDTVFYQSEPNIYQQPYQDVYRSECYSQEQQQQINSSNELPSSNAIIKSLNDILNNTSVKEKKLQDSFIN